MINQNSSDIKVSLLEKILINWATPMEVLVIVTLIKSGGSIHPRFQENIDKYGALRGIWKLKVTDYKRLLAHVSEEGNVPQNILEVYSGTPCGRFMELTYKYLRL